ncbi:MAG: Gfo/Idh/MocA family oxidoreductase [Bacteroidales bacterium]|nr:Gfo/Idh/MocA family oxidoreductase [Bacteroidales bacterium]
MIHLKNLYPGERRESVRGMCTRPLNEVRVGVVGLGARGLTAVRLLQLVEGCRIAAVCDSDSVAVNHSVEAFGWRTGSPRLFSGNEGWKDLCACEDVDLVYICTDWLSHTPVALTAMLAGKHVAIEVPAALTLDDLWALVLTSERTRRHCSLLENCCYDTEWQRVLGRIRRGEIGEVVHAEGRYYHHLGDRWSTWRLDLNRRYRGDLYPTHELGPMCQAMDINGTDRLQTLVSMDTAAFSGPKFYSEMTGREVPDFANGDHTTTILRSARGKTILLQHDVMTKQPYSRSLHFVGTRGDLTTSSDNGQDSELICSSFRSVHDPMSFEMNRRLITCLRQGTPLDIDVYDLATWCAVIPLSRLSLEQGEVVTMPDFLV